MAKRNDTSKKRPSSNSAVSTGSPIANDRNEPHRQALHEAIEAERTRLSQAQSTLECLIVALENADQSDPQHQAYYPDVAQLVLGLVRESVNRLDSVYIRPLVEAACCTR